MVQEAEAAVAVVRQRRIWVIVLIWVAVFVGAFIAAAVFADDNPSTDEGSGFGALAGIVGAVLTGIYFAVTKSNDAPLAPLRTCPSCGAKMQCDMRACPTCGADRKSTRLNSSH